MTDYSFVILFLLYNHNILVVKGEKSNWYLKQKNVGGYAPPNLRQGLRPWTHSSRVNFV